MMSSHPISGGILPPFNQNYQNAKTTLGSSRQSAHSSHFEDKDASGGMQIIGGGTTNFRKDPNKSDKYSDLKTIYNGMFKEQLQKTK